MVECNKCGQLKDPTQFSKCSSNKTGLQYSCKECNKKSNLQFRTEINPSHHAEWQRTNPQRLKELVAKYRKADKPGKIYAIFNPNGDCYIGMTETPIQVRMLEHKSHYKKDKGRLPGLHDSYDKFGFDNHKMKVLLELEEIDREQLGLIESSFIQAFKEKGKSLNIKK